MNQDSNVLYHVVLFKLHPGAPEDKKKEVFKLFQRLKEDVGGEKAGLLSFELKENMDMRKGLDWVELGVFRDNDALQAFRVHPRHKAITDILCIISDWSVGDFMAPILQLNHSAA